jgi:hypothetical protein
MEIHAEIHEVTVGGLLAVAAREFHSSDAAVMNPAVSDLFITNRLPGLRGCTGLCLEILCNYPRARRAE